jgi:hypothetical protein
MVVMALCGVIGLLVWWRGGADVAEFSGRQQLRMGIASGLLAAVGLVSCPRWFGHVGPLGYLQLSPSGVRYAQGFRTVRLSWSDIAEVGDEYPSSRKLPCPITFRLRTGGLKVFVPGAFGDNPAGIYWMIREYWEHTARREELVDGRAAERLPGRDFGTGSQAPQ